MTAAADSAAAITSSADSARVDVTTPSLYLNGAPHDRFAEMRERPGLTWHPYEASGFWAVTRHADVKEASKRAKEFSSGLGHTNLWDLEPDALEARRSIIDTDPPDHTRLRRLVSKAFTPRNIRQWENLTREITEELLDDYLASGGGDWVEMVAAPLPIRVILAILGVPAEDADFLVELSNHLVEGTGEGPSLPPDAYGNTTDLRLLPFGSPASHALYEYGENLGAKRRDDPRDDMVTMLIQASEDGDRLSHDEYRNFFHVLVFAGNETTRTAITHGAMAFADCPDQWQRILADETLLESGVEEVLRWATPVLHMRRTAATDAELSGTPISAGDKVVMWYVSANRDETVFDDPFVFDVGRQDNPHFAFGGGGPHFCLGAFLARMEISVLVSEMRKRSMVLERRGEAVHAPSNFVHGVLSVEMEASRG
ncbi:MAG: cytochrome P450 [Acidimicrobiaceae bacterium]|nr:cytochrome P450 [Acidimicrobiaceae bacterium]